MQWGMIHAQDQKWAMHISTVYIARATTTFKVTLKQISRPDFALAPWLMTALIAFHALVRLAGLPVQSGYTDDCPLYQSFRLSHSCSAVYQCCNVALNDSHLMK